MSRTDDLERLARLHDQGVLSNEEFLIEKRRVLQHTDESVHTAISSEPAGVWVATESLAKPARPDKAGAVFKIIRNFLLLALIGAGALFVVYVLGRSLSDSGAGEALRHVAASRPEPVVIEQDLNDSESSIWDASCTLVGRVRNKGADGYVLIKGVVQQQGKTFERQERRYLNREEDCAVKYTFDEVTAGGGTMQGRIEVYAANVKTNK